MKKKFKQQTSLPPNLDLETFKNFFCIGFDGAYNIPLSTSAPQMSRQMVDSIFRALDLKAHIREWEEAATSPSTEIRMVTTQNGCFFMHAYSQTNGNGWHNLISGFYERDRTGRDSIYSISLHSLFSGYEIKDGNNIKIVPSISLCRCYIDDDENEGLAIASTTEEFYAYLCYMQSNLSACLAGDTIDLTIGAAWLSKDIMSTSRDNFNQLIGFQTVEEVIAAYNAFKTGIKEALLEIDDEQIEEDNLGKQQLPPRLLN